MDRLHRDKIAPHLPPSLRYALAMPIKVYIDTNVIGHSKGCLKDDDIPALEAIAKSKRDEVSFVISDTVEREVGATTDDALRALLVFVARLSERVEVQPHQFPVRSASFFNSGQLQAINWTGVRIGQAPLYADLRKHFSAVDAEHIFRAITSGCDYFLTLDYRTILDHVEKNQFAIDELCGVLRIVGPSRLAEKLFPTRDGSD
jgi:hypothetical protein